MFAGIKRLHLKVCNFMPLCIMRRKYSHDKASINKWRKFIKFIETWLVYLLVSTKLYIYINGTIKIIGAHTVAYRSKVMH